MVGRVASSSVPVGRLGPERTGSAKQDCQAQVEVSAGASRASPRFQPGYAGGILMYTTSYVHLYGADRSQQPGTRHRLARAKIGQSKSLWVTRDTAMCYTDGFLFGIAGFHLFRRASQCQSRGDLIYVGSPVDIWFRFPCIMLSGPRMPTYIFHPSKRFNTVPRRNPPTSRSRRPNNVSTGNRPSVVWRWEWGG